MVKPSSRNSTSSHHPRKKQQRKCHSPGHGGTSAQQQPWKGSSATVWSEHVGFLIGDSWEKRDLAALPAALCSLSFSLFRLLVCTPRIPNGYHVQRSTRTASPTQPQHRRGDTLLSITLDLQRRKLGGHHPKSMRGQGSAGLGFHASARFQSGAAA